ncbi:MAG TPA: hypothetical protein VK477_14120, partial [Acidobacteriota bacterium]|nr:hypothetical protein [Acidobacteriota bacterium]
VPELEQPINVVVRGGEKAVQRRSAVKLGLARDHRGTIAEAADNVLSGAMGARRKCVNGWRDAAPVAHFARKRKWPARVMVWTREK